MVPLSDTLLCIWPCHLRLQVLASPLLGSLSVSLSVTSSGDSPDFPGKAGSSDYVLIAQHVVTDFVCHYFIPKQCQSGEARAMSGVAHQYILVTSRCSINICRLNEFVGIFVELSHLFAHHPCES